jgi:micrococcal nuclease
MQRLILAALIFVALPAHAAEYAATVTGNYDGDTLRVLIDGRRETVRLINVDTPEIKGKCRAEIDLAYRARDFAGWFTEGPVTLITGNRSRDKYGRLLAFVRNARGEDLGEAMIAAGLARPWRGKREPWCAS